MQARGSGWGTASLLVVFSCGLATSAPAAAGETKRGRAGYYRIHYPGEHGPFATRQEAIDAGLVALEVRAQAGAWSCEWLIFYTSDRYGAWWYSDPKEGHPVGAGTCEVAYSEREVRRPGSKLVATAHSHPRGDLFPDPRPRPPDNQNDHEMFLLRSDDNVWFFRPHDVQSSLYGTIRRGLVETSSRGPAACLLRDERGRAPNVSVRASRRPDNGRHRRRR